MYTESKINNILERVVDKIKISDVLFADANDEYTRLSDFINNNSKKFTIEIYPQGSFALGTVIKPITENDEYDLDIVCEFADNYGQSAKELKYCVKQWLESYRKVRGEEITEKPRCWHVEYEDLSKFHIDIIPAYYYDYNTIKITNKNKSTEEYSYISSNPRGYIKWFLDNCKEKVRHLYANDSRYVNFDEAFIEDLKRNKRTTTLQQAIQLLKRHRNIMFQDNPEYQPISIIITTLATFAYKGGQSLYDTILKVLQSFVESVAHNSGVCKILNPVAPEENFTDKWQKDSKYKEEFCRWCVKAYNDFSSMKSMTPVQMGNKIKEMFGETLGNTIVANMIEEDMKKGLSVNPQTGAIVANGTISDGLISIRENHHYGKN